MARTLLFRFSGIILLIATLLSQGWAQPVTSDPEVLRLVLLAREAAASSQPQQTITHARAALAQAEASGSARDLALAHNAMGMALANSPQQCLLHAQQALSYAKNAASSDEAARAYNLLAGVSLGQSKYDEAIAYCTQARINVRDEGILATTQQALGLAYMRKGDFDKAIVALIDGLQMAEKSDRTNQQMTLLALLGDACYRARQDDRSQAYYLRALPLAEKLQRMNTQASILNGLAACAMRQKTYDRAENYLNRALAIHSLNKDSANMSRCWVNLGVMAYEQLQYDTALAYMEKAIPGLTKAKDKVNLANADRIMAVAMVALKRYGEAISYANKSMEAYRALKMKSNIGLSAETLANVYTGLGRSDSAARYFKLQLAMRDSVFNETQSQQIAEVQTRYETEKKEQQIKALAQQNQIAVLEKERAELERQATQERLDAEQRARELEVLQSQLEAEARRTQIFELSQRNALERLRKNQFALATGVLLAGLLIVGLLFNRFRIRKRSELLRVELEESQKRYAAERAQIEAELRAIRAQMNPHFIFNTLNTIQEFVFRQDKLGASEMIGRFASLMRLTLDMSNKRVVSLDEEIRMLQLYIELEAARFRGTITHSFDLNPDLDPDEFLLPPMLVQPYVENAFRHGLLHRAADRRLAVHFDHEASPQGDTLICVIEDNGVGRARSAEINATHKQHKSFSTQANERRLQLLRRESDASVQVTYDDLAAPDGSPAGTRVTLRIPTERLT